MAFRKLSPEQLDRVVFSIRDRFGIVMGTDALKARDKAAALIRDLSQDLNEKQDKIHSWIVERSDQAFMDIISPYITVGETYFFRDRKTLRSFKEDILPTLTSGGKRTIRVCSAGCSTGEEPYTLAMIMDESKLGDRGGFRVYGTDLNEHSLKKARRAVYGRWSFRGMSDAEIVRYFDPFEDRFFQVKGAYRSKVSFDSINLVASGLPWRGGEIDVIFCRNVIMYFDDDSRKKVLNGFMDALSPDGWLVVSACETSLLEDSPFHPFHVGGQTFFRPFETTPGFNSFPSEIWSLTDSDPTWDDDNDDDSQEEDIPYLQDPVQAETSDEEESFDADKPIGIDAIRSMADRGELEEALELCLSLGNSTDPRVHYLTSIIYQDMGNLAGAKEQLRKTLFLDQSFIMAHYSLLGIAISEGNQRDKNRHMRNLKEILIDMADEDLVSDGEGATAKDILSALINL